MYDQIRDAGKALAAHRAGEENKEAMANALENLMLAVAGRDPELADVVDEFLGNEAGEDEPDEKEA